MQRRREEWEVENFPEAERQETTAILKQWGLPKDILDPATSAITQDKKKWVDFMMKEELGLSEAQDAHPAKHGLATFGAFVVAGAVPLIPYIVGGEAREQFLLSSILAAVTFFLVGAARTLVNEGNAIKDGLEILLVGGLAATVAYTIGWAVKTAFGIEL